MKIQLIKRYDTWHTTPSDASHNDCFIVEYPKSGITWFSTILANIIKLQNDYNHLNITFFNLRTIVPDIHLGRKIGPKTYTIPHQRFIKSHAQFNKNYKTVIYLVRNPTDVMNSMYRYQISRAQYNYSFSEFIRSKNGLCGWVNHVDSWLNSSPAGGVLHLLRYEDLVDNAEKCLRPLLANLGWAVCDKHLLQAIQMSSVDIMKSSEKQFTDNDPRYDLSFIKSHPLKISQDDLDYIHYKTKHLGHVFTR